MTLRLPRALGAVVMPVARGVTRARIAVAKRTATPDAQRLLEILDGTLRGVTDDEAEVCVARIETLPPLPGERRYTEYYGDGRLRPSPH